MSNSQINLAWTASTDNVAVTNYIVERCRARAARRSRRLARSATTTFTDTGLHRSTTYSYRVRATDAAREPQRLLEHGQRDDAGQRRRSRSCRSMRGAADAAGDGAACHLPRRTDGRQSERRGRRLEQPDGQVQSVIDSRGNTYYACGRARRRNRHSATQSIYYAANIACGGAGANTVTVTFDGGSAIPGHPDCGVQRASHQINPWTALRRRQGQRHAERQRGGHDDEPHEC